MTFQEILPKFLKGAKIRKTSWTKQYVYINNKNVIVDENNNVCHLQGHNLVEDGWEIYDDREYFDFNKVLKYLEEGKCVSRKNWKKLSCHHQYIFKDKTDKKLYNDREERIYWIADEDIFAKDWFLVEEE